MKCGSAPSHVIKMATTYVLIVFVFLSECLYGQLIGDLNQQRVGTGEINKTKVLVDFVLFRNLMGYDIESNDIASELLKTDAAEKRSTLAKHPTNIKVEDEIIIKLLNDQSSHKRGKYNLISKHSESGSILENNRNNYETFRRKINGEKDKKISSNGMLEKHSIESKTVTNEEKLMSSVLDKMVDFLLEIVRDGLHETGRDQIALPDVDEQFSAHILFIPVEGRFRAQDGWFRNLSTVYRTGEVDVTTTSYAISVEFDLGLKITQFNYQEYIAQLVGIQVSGSLIGSIAYDSIATKISLAYVNGTCKANLDSLKVTSLDGIDVELTGATGIGWLLTFIANCVSGSYRDQIIYAVEQALSHILEEKLQKLPCEHLFSST